MNGSSVDIRSISEYDPRLWRSHTFTRNLKLNRNVYEGFFRGLCINLHIKFMKGRAQVIRGIMNPTEYSIWHTNQVKRNNSANKGYHYEDEANGATESECSARILRISGR